MPKRSRVEYPGAFYRVINRGNDRSSIFVTAGLRKSGRNETDLIHSLKGVDWKDAVARLLRDHYLVPNK